jgi:hypothetical protein
VLKQNAEDGGSRRFILVEMDENIAQNVTRERVKRVAEGYTNAKGTAVEGLGGGFQFCRLFTEPLFDADGQIRCDVSFAQLAEFVWFAETGTGFPHPGPLPGGEGEKLSPLLGVHQDHAIYLPYNGILKDKSVGGGNVLTGPVFDVLPKLSGPKVIYAAANRMGTLSEWCEVPTGVVAQIMVHKPSALAEKHYRRRPLDLLRNWHVKIEAWILEQAGIEFVPAKAGLRVVFSYTAPT